LRVVVFGAAGRLGQATVPLLAAAGVDVVAVVRRQGQLEQVEHLGGHGVLGDVEGGPYGDLAPALAGADAVVWAAGAAYGDGPGHSDRIRDGAIRALQTAAAADVTRWIQVSSMYANRWQTGPEPMRATLANKQAVDETLQASDLAWTIVRPGGLVDEPPTGSVTVAPELPAGRVTRTDVGAVIAELLRSGGGMGAAFDLTNGDTPIEQALAAL
jgi:uncharacterized protein YbjT (DUF2867 family)